MEFTEKDMYYIAEGRTNLERAKITVPWVLLAFVLCIPAIVLIESKWISVPVFIAILVVMLYRPLRGYLKSYKEVELQSKEMYHKWQLEQKIINRRLNAHYD